MSVFLDKARSLLPEFVARLTVRRDSGPIDSVAELTRFVSTRAAFTAQKTLYGYLKTRMGTRYPSMFEDEVFVASIDIAKMQVFAACLADLAIFAVWQTRRDAPRPPEAAVCKALALCCFQRGLADNAEQATGVQDFSAEAAQAGFERRLALWDWARGPQGPDIFTESPPALVRWAPIAPELKKFDREIVENSIRFKWREVRADLVRRLDAAAVAAEAAEGRLSTRTAARR